LPLLKFQPSYVHSDIGLGISGVAAGDCKMYGTRVVIVNGFMMQVCFLRARSPLCMVCGSILKLRRITTALNFASENF